MRSTLLLRLAGPRQCWPAFRARVTETGDEPSKSGVVGLLGAALGVDRGDRVTISRLSALEMAVRVDSEGGKRELDGVVCLIAASFLVAISGDASLLKEAHAAIQAPRYPLYLGRRGFVPRVPIWEPGEPVDMGALEALFAAPLAGGARTLRYVTDCAPETPHARPRRDVPIRFDREEALPPSACYRVRYVRTFRARTPPIEVKGPTGDIASDMTNDQLAALMAEIVAWRKGGGWPGYSHLMRVTGLDRRSVERFVNDIESQYGGKGDG